MEKIYDQAESRQNPRPPDPGTAQTVAPIAGRLVAGAAFAALALLIFLKLADEVMENETMRFDAAIIQFFHQHSTPFLHALMAGITYFASGPYQTGIVIVVTLWFLWKRRFWPDGAAMLLAGLGGLALEHGLKMIFHRQRPEPVFYHLGYSFPSGHSFFAVVVYGMLAYFAARQVSGSKRIWVWILAAVAILIVGFSRVYLRQHYPTDVMGGYAAGICWLWGCVALPEIWGKHRASASAATIEDTHISSS